MESAILVDWQTGHVVTRVPAMSDPNFLPINEIDQKIDVGLVTAREPIETLIGQYTTYSESNKVTFVLALINRVVIQHKRGNA